ncbi:MAG: type II secretion system F family protein, partial [Patescibacteria group bacterium]
MQFKYQAKDNKGHIISGLVQSMSLAQAEGLIQDKGLTVVSLEECKKKIGDIKLSFLEKIKIKDLVLFYRQLSMMISSDIPVVKALQIISSQAQNSKMQKVLAEIYENVNEGMKFSDAMFKHKKIFGDFYINMIRSGEISGKFDEVLLYLADSQEKDYQFKAKLKGAMTYPMFILSAMFLMGLGMMIFVVPRLTAMLLESGVKLPITTRMLIAASDFTKHFWYLIIVAVVGGIFGLKAFINKTLLGKKIWHKALLKIPKFGSDLVQKTYLVHLIKSMAMLLTGGVPLTQAIEITSKVIGNYYYEKMLKFTADSVKDGNTIASVFMQYPNLIPNMLTQMTS